MNASRIRAKKIWKAIGNRQDTVLGSRKENPKSIQYDKQIPPVIIAPSIITIFPRLCDLEVSDAQVGTVEVFMPRCFLVSITQMEKLNVPKHLGCPREDSWAYLEDSRWKMKYRICVPLPNPVMILPTIK
jgi:hypothetical protein